MSDRRNFLKSALLALACHLLMTACTSPSGDGRQLRALFTEAKPGDTLVIPPGDYALDGREPIPLKSGLTVIADGATFRLPATLGDKARIVVFQGQDITDLRWTGGRFVGHVFDSKQPTNTWEPNANTRGILITTSAQGRTGNLRFEKIQSDDLAGAAITVLGAEKSGSEREIVNYAKGVVITGCRLERTGKFMWDYGYLWQITLWPDDFNEAERANARKYFPPQYIREGVTMSAGDDRVFFDNRKQLPLSRVRLGLEKERGYDSLCFFGDTLPANLQRGRQYFVVESTPTYVRIAEQPLGKPLRFATSAGPKTKLIMPLFQAHLALYAPTGSGPGKGSFDLVGCEDVVVRGCTLSALGDTMHVQKSRRILFDRNAITGSRMGAFFLAEFCQEALVTNNTVDGTNGSRVVSIEKSCHDITVRGNTFRNGGRGTWINQPTKLLLEDNTFENNTTKCEPDPARGRRSFVTGDYESYAEVYFTVYEPNGTYGDVIIRHNRFISGPHARHALTFAPGGKGIEVRGNTFAGPIRTMPPAEGCTEVVFADNQGLNQ